MKEITWKGAGTDELIWRRYARYMNGRASAATTQGNYAHTLGALSRWLEAHGAGDGLTGANRLQVEDWLDTYADREQHAQSSHATHMRRARAFYAWATKNEYLDGPSPLARTAQLAEGKTLIPIPDPDDLAAVLRTVAKDRTFRGRRDHAIMRLLLETGTPRSAAMAALRTADVDLLRDKITVRDKGDKQRVVPFGESAGHALTLYVRERNKRKDAGLPQLFLGSRGKGAMTRDGIYNMLEARCRQAGVKIISPHKWRHFSAHEWFLAGGSEADAMALFGWESPAMAHRYAAAAQATRAQQHSRELSLADRIAA